MAGPTTTGGSLNTVSIATITKYLKVMADNITNGPGLMRYAKRKGLIRSENLTGPQEQVPIDRGTNTNGQWFDDADAWTIGANNELIDSYAGHFNFRSGFTISDTEQLENTSEEKIFDLLDLRMNVCKRAMTIQLSQAMVGLQGSNTKAFTGIRDLMGGTTPSSITGSYQSLSASTYTWWKPDFQAISTGLGPNNSQMRFYNIHQFANLKLKMGNPKVGICDQLYYENWVAMVGGGAETYGFPNSRQQNFSADAPLGRVDSGGPTDSPVADLRWMGREIIFDEYVAVPSAYTSGTDFHINWIDTDFFYYKVDPRWNFKLFKPRERSGDDNQYVSAYAIVFRATPICTMRRAHGLTVFDL